MIRVLIVDDHASFRQPLMFMIERESDLTVVGQAGSLADARRMLEGMDVAILDLDLPDGNGVALIHELRESSPNCSIMILTASVDRSELARTVEAGAAGILHKSSRIDEIIDGIRRLHEGENLLSARETIELLRLASRNREQDREGQDRLRRLTAREVDVLSALSLGLGDKEIAEHLQVSTETVRTHMANILSKLGVQSRLQALVFAVRHDAVHIP